METHFQKELQELKGDLLKMAALVEEAISTAVQSLDARVIKHYADVKEESEGKNIS